MAHQAAFHAVANANVHRELAKVYKPEKFSLRSKNTQAVETFFYRMDKYFRLLGITNDNMQVEIASFTFEGDIAIWWRARYEGLPMTYANFKNLVRERWADEYDMQNARNRLNALVQTKSASSLIAELDSVCLRIPNITDEEKRDKLIRALKPQVAQQVMLCDGLDTYEKVAAKAVLIDDTLFRFRRTQGSTAMEVGNIEYASDYVNDSEDSMGPLAAFHQGGRDNRGARHPNGQFKKQHNGPSGNTQGKAFKGKCFNCGNHGHIAKDCKQPPKPRPNGPNGSAPRR